MIKAFKCADTEALFNRQRVACFVNFESVARRKLEQLNQAGHVDDLRVPSGNGWKPSKATGPGSTVSA